MPRLAHTKTRRGCRQCKARKVKCDESQPSCRSCQRHNLDCEYERFWINASVATQEATKSSDTSTQKRRGPPRRRASLQQDPDGARTRPARGTLAAPPPPQMAAPVSIPAQVSATTHMLELRLMHQYTAFTSLSFTNTGQELWSRLAPQLAFSFDFLLEAIFAVAALHLSKLNPQDTEIMEVSRRHLKKALEGQSRAFHNIQNESIAEALVLTGVLTCFHALALSGCEDEEMTGENSDPSRWLRVGSGAVIIFRACAPYLVHSKAMEVVFRAEPNLLDQTAKWDPANRGELQALLEWGADYESISDEDKDAYERTVSYIGLVYASARAAEEDPMLTCRRVLAVPSVTPDRFMELVEERRPRALAIMAYLYAAIKSINADLWWKDGVAERQIPMINKLLPKGWRHMIELPMQLAS